MILTWWIWCWLWGDIYVLEWLSAIFFLNGDSRFADTSILCKVLLKHFFYFKQVNCNFTNLSLIKKIRINFVTYTIKNVRIKNVTAIYRQIYHRIICLFHSLCHRQLFSFKTKYHQQGKIATGATLSPNNGRTFSPDYPKKFCQVLATQR